MDSIIPEIEGNMLKQSLSPRTILQQTLRVLRTPQQTCKTC
uniref:Uncharacterized protein n=1 Tax=Steinernema glaseri TaxID=37863 RepID=A0A1I8ABG6_9BILA